MNSSLVRKLVLLCTGLVGFVGCWSGSSEEHGSQQGMSADPDVVTVFAAASVTNAVNAIKATFASQTGIQVQTSYAGSSTLAQQIAHRADADIFLPADVEWADYVESQRGVARRRSLLGNRLVIIVPTESDLPLATAEDLLDKQVRHLALADPDAVPAGKYAKQALMKLGLWEKLRGRVAAAKDVRQALTYVETGAAEAGIVYATDAAVSDQVEVAVQIPAGLTDPVLYPVLLLTPNTNNESAERFYDYLCSAAAARVFEQSGFVTYAGADMPIQPVNDLSLSTEP